MATSTLPWSTTALLPTPPNESPKRAEIREAKAKCVCAECSVREPCLETAREDPGTYIDLVMGGLSYVERLRSGELPPRTSKARSKIERAVNRERKQQRSCKA